VKHALVLLLDPSPSPLPPGPSISKMQAVGEQAPMAAEDQALFAAPLIAPFAEVTHSIMQ
jgi:hypothetical protein